MPDHHDEQFERYLKSFRPFDPEPLPVRVEGKVPSTRRRVALAVGAVVCLAAAAVMLVVLPRRPLTSENEIRPRPVENVNHIEISMPVLTNLALDDHDAFVELMTKQAESQFPPMKNEQSALRILAKE